MTRHAALLPCLVAVAACGSRTGLVVSRHPVDASVDVNAPLDAGEGDADAGDAGEAGDVDAGVPGSVVLMDYDGRLRVFDPQTLGLTPQGTLSSECKLVFSLAISRSNQWWVGGTDVAYRVELAERDIHARVREGVRVGGTGRRGSSRSTPRR